MASLIPVLETSRLILRPYRYEDVSAQYRYINDWEVARYLGAGFPWPYTQDSAQEFVDLVLSDQWHRPIWAITTKDNGDELIGCLELRPDETEGQRGFWLAGAFQNRGLMTEASVITNDFWFDVLDKPSLHMVNAVGNPASRRIKEKTGAVFHGVRVGQFLDPSLTEEEVWMLTKRDWQNFKEKHPCQN